jgi:NAD-dependent deacetylase
VWFGEVLPRGALEAAVQAATDCDVFFSIGTSGLVEPAASLARLARQRGATVVEVNPTATPLTSCATFVLQGASGEVMPALIKSVWPG